MDYSHIIIMALLVLCSAYFSATETAFSSMNKTKLKALAEKGDRRAKRACELSEKYDRLISTILIGNNIVNIALASLATIFFINLCGQDYGAQISTVVVTVVVLVFGEITPKSIAKDCPERFAKFSAPLINLFIWICLPLNLIFSGWKKLIAKVLRLDTDTKMSQEELLLLVEEVQQDGSIDENEGELLSNVIEFSGIEAKDILTHRVDLEAVPEDAEKSEIAELFESTKFSRILVYRESIDNIIGVIHQKDFYTGMGVTEKPLPEIISPVIYVLKNEKINDMLKQLQKNKSHLAVVIDEFGGTYGIVTMEDILEELVGEIWDEHDEVVEGIKKCDVDTYTANTAMNLDDFCEHFGIEVESDSSSLCGWIMGLIDKIPEQGDVIEYENLTITVEEVDNHRITAIKIVAHPVAQTVEN